MQPAQYQADVSVRGSVYRIYRRTGRNILSFLISFVINAIVASSGAMGVEGNISYIPLWLAAASMIFAVFVGMAAGYFPALRAMRLSPLSAIHNE